MLAIPEADHILMLAGAGSVRAGAADALRRFAHVVGLAVANTYGAKGLFAWQSEHHMGTVGLQRDDFRLLGFAEADVLLSCGVEPDEAPRAHWALAREVIELAPAELGALADAWTRPRRAIRSNDFLKRMSGVVQPLYATTKFPLSPARAVFHYREVLQASDLLAADPGPAGLWVARAFPTTVLGSICVPASVTAESALHSAVAAAQSGRRALAVSCGPLSDSTLALLERARQLGLSLVLDVWSDEPVPAARDVGSLEQHRELLHEAFAQPGVSLLRTPVDLRDTARLVEVAGPVIAWPELTIPFAGRT